MQWKIALLLPLLLTGCVDDIPSVVTGDIDKTIIRSPWGNYIKLRIGTRIYERTAQGGYWTGGSMPSSFLNIIAKIAPVVKIVPDEFSPIMQGTLPYRVHTDMWKDRP